LVLAYGYFAEVLSFDLSMTLDMHFQSTLVRMVVVHDGVARRALGRSRCWTMWWRKTLRAESMIEERHFHDIGKLVFAFTAFWGYLTFGQYLRDVSVATWAETHWFRSAVQSIRGRALRRRRWC